jgi:phosphopentomutase
LAALTAERRVFVFLNVSAIHQPNRIYLPGHGDDDVVSHGAALRYIDARIPRLVEIMRRRGRWFAIACSDHGTAYGEAGLRGHRLADEVVWTVPYAEFEVGGKS